MASRDTYEISRDMKRSSGFVLVHRRSAASRKGRGRLGRGGGDGRKSSSGSTRPSSGGGADSVWMERGSPGAERSTAKGKRLCPSGWSDQDSDSGGNSDGVYPRPDPHSLHQSTAPSGQPRHRFPPFSSPHCPPSSSHPGDHVHLEVSEEREALQVRPWAGGHLGEDATCAGGVIHHVSVPRGLGSSLPRSQPVVLRPSVCCSQGCALSPESCRVHSCSRTAAGHCVRYPHSPRGARHHKSGETVDADCSSEANLVGHIARAPTPPQPPTTSVWLDWQQPSETCGRPNAAVSSRVCICSSSQCCAGAEQVLGHSRFHVCESTNACDTKSAVVFSQRVEFSPRRGGEDSFTSCVSARKRHSLRDHQVIVNLDSGDGDCERSEAEESSSRNIRGTYNHSCPACPCLRCQQRRLTSPTRSVSKQLGHRVFPSHSNSSDSLAYCTRSPSPVGLPPELAPRSSCSRKKSDWTRMVRMRYVGRCLLVLLLIGFGGLLAHVTVTDVSSGVSNGGVDGSLGAGVILGGGCHVDLLMKIQMRPVPVKEFQARLRTVRNKFDLLRIFLADKDMSDESLMRLLTAAMLASPPHAVVHADNKIAVTSSMDDVDVSEIAVASSMDDVDVSKIEVASSMDDVDEEFSPVSRSDNLHIKVSADDAQGADSHLLGKEGLSNPSKSETPNVTRKDNESADSGVIKEKPRKGKDRKDHASLSGEEDPRRERPKRVTPKSKKKEANKKDSPRNAGSRVKSTRTVKSPTTTVAYEASQNEPVITDTVESPHPESRVEKDRREDMSPSSYKISDVESDVREDRPSFSLKMSGVKSDVTENTSPPSRFEVSDIRSDVTQNTSPPSRFEVSDIRSDVRDGESLSPPKVQASDVKSSIRDETPPSKLVSGVREEMSYSSFKVSDVGEKMSHSSFKVSDVREEMSHSSFKVSDVREEMSHSSFKVSDVGEETPPSSSTASDVKSGVREETTSHSAFSDVKSDIGKNAPPQSSLLIPDVKNEAVANTPPFGSSDDIQQDKVFDDEQLAEVYKRAEPLYDDDDFPEDEEIREEDYLDGEVDYYSDAAHADAILEELEEAVHHIAEMENNPQALCRDPLPQVVYIEDPKKQNRQFYPECTVIHRCRNDSGCCGRNYECGPKYEQVIFRTFLAVTVNETAHTVLPDSRMVERIALVNHTECQCREKPRLPDCTQACPGVFRMYRYGSRCVCDCHSSANERFPQCDDVKEGLLSLPQDDLVCIKSGKCGVPRCASGQFDVSTGFCPLRDVYSIPSPLLRERLRRQYQQRRHQRRSQDEREASSPPGHHYEDGDSSNRDSRVAEEGSGDL